MGIYPPSMAAKPTVVACYLRLSQEDAAQGESCSISNQRDLLRSALQAMPDLQNCQVVEICDDGYSGTNFDRPGIKQLLELVQKGEVNCVVVKDFSRFGRNYIEVGSYLQQVFPALGVRFVSVNDQFDSAQQKSSGLDMAFKNLIHDLYSKDLSQKVKAAKTARQRKGKYSSPYALFGYQKSAQDKNKLEPNPVTAPFVKRIFLQAASGSAPTAIARALNQDAVPTPHMFRNGSAEANFWTKAAVTRILRDERYTGKMLSGKRERVEVGNKATRKLPQNGWSVVENTHSALVSEALFCQVQERLGIFHQKQNAPKLARTLPFAVKCGQCGHTMAYKNGAVSSYRCHTARVLHTPLCAENSMEEQTFLFLFTQVWQRWQLLSGSPKRQAAKAMQAQATAATTHRKQEQNRQKSIKKLQCRQTDLYQSYVEGQYSHADYTKEWQRLQSMLEPLFTPSKMDAMPESAQDSLLARVEQLTCYSPERIEVTLLADRAMA